MAIERLQKILARAGIASRRKAEELIQMGEVTINGKTAQLGDKADPDKDAIKVSGKLLHVKQSHVYYAFHKPKGVISMATKDPEGRPTLADFLEGAKIRTRLFPVGRLDFNGEGLVLLTNDGDLAERIQKSKDIVRVYHVKIKGHPTEADLQKLTKGARMEHGVLRPHSADLIQILRSKAWVRVAFVGMGMLEIKEMFQKLGFLVERVVRVQIGQIELARLPSGAFALLKKVQLEALVDKPELGLEVLERKPHLEIRTPEQNEADGEFVPDSEGSWGAETEVTDWRAEIGDESSGSEAPQAGWGRPVVPSATTAAGRRAVKGKGQPMKAGAKKRRPKPGAHGKPGARAGGKPGNKPAGKPGGRTGGKPKGRTFKVKTKKR